MTKSQTTFSKKISSKNHEIATIMAKLLNCSYEEIMQSMSLFDRVDALKLNCLNALSILENDEIIAAHLELQYLLTKKIINI